MKQIPITRCQYCGSNDIGEGWQHGEALVTFKRHGLLGNRLKHLICRDCGAILYTRFCPPTLILNRDLRLFGATHWN